MGLQHREGIPHTKGASASYIVPYYILITEKGYETNAILTVFI